VNFAASAALGRMPPCPERGRPTDRPTGWTCGDRSLGESPSLPSRRVRETFAQAPSLSPSELVDEDRKEKGSHPRRGTPERKLPISKSSAQARERLAATAWAQPPQRGGMLAMGTVARSGTVWERGARGEREIGPPRPQICPLSDAGRLGGARVAGGGSQGATRRRFRPTPAARGPRRTAGRWCGPRS